MSETARSEQSIIERHFKALDSGADGVLLGIGDDAAIVQLPAGEDLVTSVDTLIESVHFRTEDSPRAIGYKSLAVNLSDMAAMGATPGWATLALTLPRVDHAWLTAFVSGFADLARQHHVALVGGDLTRGPLAISVQIMGTVPHGSALTRSKAKSGDAVFVSGQLGAAAAELRTRLAAGPVNADSCLDYPVPRIDLGLALRGVASAAIDLSDGLLRDLNRMLQASKVGATINVADIPTNDLDMALQGGDDYELCFTAPLSQLEYVNDISQRCAVPLTRIGRIEAQPGLRCKQNLTDGSERIWKPDTMGFDHFE